MDQYPTGNRRNAHSLSYYPNYLANGYPVPVASNFIYKTNTTSFPHNQLEQKQDGNLSRKCLNILIGFLVIWAVVSTVLAIVYGIKYDHNTCMAPSEQSGLNPENPNLLRGSVTIENLMYDDTLKDHSSPLFKFYKDLICNEIVENVKDQVPVEGCDILQMSPGSLSASWVIGPKSANDIELDGVAAKVEDSLNNWMLASKKFQGRIGRVYRDACALMEDNPCQQMCVFDNKKGNMDCACEEGFKLNDDRTTCSDIDECLAASCPDKCINTDGGYKCVCPEGYTQAENGRDCTDTNECETSPCADICVNTNGSYWCSCGPNKVMSADGINCLNASLITTLDYDMEIKVTGSNISLVCMLLVTGPVREVALQWQAPDMKVIQDDINESVHFELHSRKVFQPAMRDTKKGGGLLG
ncbi:hypothetical protein LSH36_258g04035 [Paralvinella palmiformis]|uniref:EGF-like domain-containing protein n=1 Tax=Paralvinella palmiformis TaxID=53620 RepID=A0AAD9JL60_9ANNE|nr:hypothetical protein LSH36_258g04035 [Paralvinella palmiformis]